MGFTIEFIFTLNENKYFEIKEKLREKIDWRIKVFMKKYPKIILILFSIMSTKYHIYDLMSKYHSARLDLEEAIKIANHEKNTIDNS